MKKSRFTKSQIVTILKEAESGIVVAEVLRSYGINGDTFYINGVLNMEVWKPLSSSGLKRLSSNSRPIKYAGHAHKRQPRT